MVKVMGSAGKIVNIEIRGIGEVIRMLQAKGKIIKIGEDLGVVRAGTWVEGEVKESIAGHRAEQRSVRTGLFGNSIEFFKISDGVGVVKVNPQTYPGTSTTTEDVAGFLEKDRQHFTNTRERTKGNIRDIIADEVKQSMR